MKNKKASDTTELIANFGDEFGTLTKQNISDVFVDIHASISPLDPLFKLDAELESQTME